MQGPSLIFSRLLAIPSLLLSLESLLDQEDQSVEEKPKIPLQFYWHERVCLLFLWSSFNMQLKSPASNRGSPKVLTSSTCSHTCLHFTSHVLLAQTTPNNHLGPPKGVIMPKAICLFEKAKYQLSLMQAFQRSPSNQITHWKGSYRYPGRPHKSLNMA